MLRNIAITRGSSILQAACKACRLTVRNADDFDVTEAGGRRVL
jgi:hypothetical protein